MKRFVLLAALAACGPGDDPHELTVIAPENLAELVPGATMELSWESPGSTSEALHVNVVAQSVPGGIDYPLRCNGETTETCDWDGTYGDFEPMPIGAYELRFSLNSAKDNYDSEVRNVMLHGVTITDPARGEAFVVSAPYEVKFTVATMRPMELAISLDRTPFTVGDEIGFSTVSIPGEFVPHGHTATFEGTDADGAPMPSGTYSVVIDAADPNSDLRYRVDGGVFVWTP